MSLLRRIEQGQGGGQQGAGGNNGTPTPPPSKQPGGPAQPVPGRVQAGEAILPVCPPCRQGG